MRQTLTTLIILMVHARSVVQSLVDNKVASLSDHNWALLHALPELVATGVPVLVGASRKRFLGALLADADGAIRPPDGRETATAVVSALSALQGAWGVRVHDVRASVDALKVVRAWDRGGDGDG